MTDLEAVFAAKLAADIYEVADPYNRKVFHAKYKKSFNLGEDSSLSAKGLKGKTGGILLQTEHMMAVAAEGIENSKYDGQAIVGIKGTANLMDLLTDLNCGVTAAKTGGMVHQGFQDAFNSFANQLPTFSAKIHTIHCVGHSLGGALATLVADLLKYNTGRQVKLYTFGSPRVGLDLFSSRVNRKLGGSNIFRVYHKSDPVPMVPTWPFIHVPDGGAGDYMLPSADSLRPSKQHSSNTYVKSTKSGASSLSWDILKSMRPADILELSITAWLKADSIVSLTLSTARLLSAALLWVVEKVINLAGIALVIGAGSSFTVLDRLAIAMHKALDFSKDLSFWVLRLIKRMAQLVGVIVIEGADVTAAFIRVVFVRMHHAVSDLVRQASRGLGS